MTSELENNLKFPAMVMGGLLLLPYLPIIGLFIVLRQMKRSER